MQLVPVERVNPNPDGKPSDTVQVRFWEPVLVPMTQSAYSRYVQALMRVVLTMVTVESVPAAGDAVVDTEGEAVTVVDGAVVTEGDTVVKGSAAGEMTDGETLTVASVWSALPASAAADGTGVVASPPAADGVGAVSDGATVTEGTARSKSSEATASWAAEGDRTGVSAGVGVAAGVGVSRDCA